MMHPDDGLIDVDQGELDHPWLPGRALTEAPLLHPTTVVKNSRMGAWTSLGPRCVLVDSTFRDWAYAVSDADIHNADVGKFCNVAAQVRINPTNHPLWRAALHHFTYRSRSHRLGADDDEEIFAWRRAHRVTIGPDVWIGHAAILLPGVSVGAGAAIGAGSVVTRDVPPFAIVVGAPARLIRRRVAPEVEEALLRIAWWDWPRERLAEALPDFRRLDAAAFARTYDPA
jgi:phosphonate metabolism protein (transferase hexapeptide repeat family)